jgi:hypothetical protein
MTDLIPGPILWWIVAVDIPLFTTIFSIFSRFRRETEDHLSALRDTLAHYKLEVAQSYASISQMKDLESRLVAHLLRIESKLEHTRTHALKKGL